MKKRNVTTGEISELNLGKREMGNPVNASDVKIKVRRGDGLFEEVNVEEAINAMLRHFGIGIVEVSGVEVREKK